MTFDPEKAGRNAVDRHAGALRLLADAPTDRCPAYGKDCDCPTGSAVRAICERTAANIHR